MRKLNQPLLEKLLREHLKKQIESCRVSAAHILVLQEGQQVCSVCEGYQNWRTKEPLRPDALYRLASMTKPVTAVAALIAEDLGYFQITDKVEEYLPEFADMYVGKYENGNVVPGERSQTPLRIWHLLSHCSGIMPETPMGSWITALAGKSAYRTRNAMIAFASAQPLAFEPETYTAYTARVSFDMVTKIIELKSGMPYSDFITRYLFEPLKLRDITYYPTEEQWGRMLDPTDRLGGIDMVPIDLGRHTFEALPLCYTGGGSGLAGSAGDYAVFAEMLRSRGIYRGVRIFAPERTQELTTPYVPPETPGRNPVSSWGLGVRVVDREDVLPVGSFGWSGAYGTHFWIDPVNQITAVYMRSSRWYDSHGGGSIADQFEKDVMAALE